MLPALPGGVTPSNIHYLDTISKLEKTEGKVKVSDISENLGLPRPSVTKTVKDMEKLGFVEKETTEKDGRFVYIKTTRTGRDLVLCGFGRYANSDGFAESGDFLLSSEKASLFQGREADSADGGYWTSSVGAGVQTADTGDSDDSGLHDRGNEKGLNTRKEYGEALNSIAKRCQGTASLVGVGATPQLFLVRPIPRKSPTKAQAAKCPSQ